LSEYEKLASDSADSKQISISVALLEFNLIRSFSADQLNQIMRKVRS